METFKKICKKLLFPHPAIIILLVPISAVLLICSFLVWENDAVFNYISYVISAYALTVVCVRIPKIIGYIKKFKAQNKKKEQ